MGKYSDSLDRLESWFERQKRVLPWRNDPSLYRVWVSEIMLQQTQVATVVPYFERFIARFPTVDALAGAPQEDVLLHWAGLGYYSRARNLHRAAQRIVERGGFPRNRQDWLQVPGVGGYTAGAILSIALDQPEAILDGNVERVLSRIRRVGRARGDAAFKARLWRLSRAFVERGHARGLRPSSVNQALMELGATICTPRKPKCLLCPLAELCRARMAGEQEAYPPRKKPKQWVQVAEETHCVLDARGNVLLRKREKGEWRAGLWDLPASLEEARAAIPGELVRVGEIQTRYVVTRHKVARKTTVWRAGPGWRAAEPSEGMGLASGPDLRWVSTENPGLPVGSPLKQVLAQLPTDP